MPNVVSFVGPVQVSFESEFPLPLTLRGQLRGEQGVSAIVSCDPAARPEWPTDLRDTDIETPADGPDVNGHELEFKSYLLRAGGKVYPFEARRVFVHRDLSVLMQSVVPAQPVSSAYRWRWRLGIFLARIQSLTKRSL